MHATTRLLAIALCLTLAPLTSTAHAYKLGPLKIDHPWSRPTPPGAPTAAGFLAITNTGMAPDRFLGGSSPVVDHIEVHQMSLIGGVMRMRPLADGLELAPGATVRLAPGGFHLMLIGPKQAFRIGDRIPATLRFARAGRIQVEFEVQAEAPAEAQAGTAAMEAH
jgi:periplasmic copper chaperone A